MEHVGFPSIGRLYRDVCITEKIDGMNAAVVIDKVDSDGSLVDSPALAGFVVGNSFYHIGAQSRNKMLTLEDSFGLWVFSNGFDLIHTLGEGRHFGEWWGKGIQRGYHQRRNWFSLFNTKRWNIENTKHVDGLLVVPILYEGIFDATEIQGCLNRLDMFGSMAAKQVADVKASAEGIMGWHTKLQTYFKITLDGDGHKGVKNARL